MVYEAKVGTNRYCLFLGVQAVLDEVSESDSAVIEHSYEVSEESTSMTIGSDFNIEYSGDGPTEELHDDDTNEYHQNSDEVFEETVGSEESSSTTTENDFAFEESTETVLDKNVETADTNMIILWLVVIMIETFVGTSMIFMSISYVKYRRSLKLHKDNVP